MRSPVSIPCRKRKRDEIERYQPIQIFTGGSSDHAGFGISPLDRPDEFDNVFQAIRGQLVCTVQKKQGAFLRKSLTDEIWNSSQIEDGRLLGNQVNQ